MRGKRASHLPRARAAASSSRDTLARAARTVDASSCYRRAAPAGDARGLARSAARARATALTLTSTEGVDNLSALLGDDGRARCARIPTFVPHPRIAEHARALGFDARLTPASGDAGLIAGLLEWASARTTRAPD